MEEGEWKGARQCKTSLLGKGYLEQEGMARPSFPAVGQPGLTYDIDPFGDLEFVE